VLTVTTVNVNGIRAAAKKGFTEWLSATPADVVCLQEVRAEPDQFPPALHEPEGWHTLVAPAAAKGRAGVALYSRMKPISQRVGFGSKEFDTSGRYVEMEFPNVIVGSLYLPSGEVGTPRQEEKERFMAEFHAYLTKRRKGAAKNKQEVLVCGDWNIAHRKTDLKNWSANQKSAGFLPEEREWFTSVIDVAGYVDVTRALHPDAEGPYSWWSFRGQAFNNDTGWRIDYHMASKALAKSATSSVVERAATFEERWSDHSPVTVTFDWEVPGCTGRPAPASDRAGNLTRPARKPLPG
jgi:exodeoxyribonuclease III